MLAKGLHVGDRGRKRGPTRKPITVVQQADFKKKSQKGSDVHRCMPIHHMYNDMYT